MASIRKRKLPGGRTVWQVDYRDGEGGRRHRQFPTKREADGFMVHARAEVAVGVHTPDTASITIADAADLWLLRCERDGLEETTLRQYRAHVNLHIRPRLAGQKLSRLTVPTINAFADQLMLDGRSAEMTKRVLASLSSIVSEAQRRGLVATNNVRSAAPIKRTRRADARPEMPTRDELRAIIQATMSRHRPFILTAIFTGLRGSELRGLQWQDVDLKSGLIRVRRRVDRFNKFGPPKSEAGTRDIPISASLVAVLREWKLACPKGELGLVFPTGSGNVENHGNILSRMFWPIQVAAGVVNWIPKKDADGKTVLDSAGKVVTVADPKFSLHALRHAAAALWIEQKLSPKRVQTLMGHASIQQTFDQYGYLFELNDDDRHALAAIEKGLLAP